MQDRHLRVLVDARYWRPAITTGVERYLALLAEALASKPADLAMVVTGSGHELPGVKMFPVADRRDATMRAVTRAYAPDVIHYPFDLPARLTHPSVFTLHDAGRYRFPELMVRRVREVQNARLHRHLAGEHLRSVVTVSHAGAGDIVEELGPLPCPLEVVPNFVAAPFAAMLRRSRPAADGGYLLAVGVYMPTKNIPFLVRAFRLARAAAPQVVPPRLVLAGRLGWERRLPAGADVTVTGHVSDEELAELYAGASAFVFPSFYEGFGIPVLEALTAGTPVLCSDIPVFREIGRDLVHYADPYDESAFAEAIVRRCRQPPPARAQVDRLLRDYSAEACGEALLATYTKGAAA